MYMRARVYYHILYPGDYPVIVPPILECTTFITSSSIEHTNGACVCVCITSSSSSPSSSSSCDVKAQMHSWRANTRAAYTVGYCWRGTPHGGGHTPT